MTEMTELINRFTDALIPAVQITRQIMATLLAAQIFFAFELCGLVCCVSGQAVEPSRTVAQAQPEAQPAESASHCHAKAEKKAPAKAQLSATPNCHGGKLGGQAFAASSARICQCDAEGQPAQDVSPMPSDSTQQKCAVAAVPLWLDVEQVSPQPSASPPKPLSSSPPFSGHQLSLRI